ncbi:MAG: UDP-N-acetylglucosamine 2-epimerase (non-hydrolyzing) [Bacteroidales bacterium]|nr:UDP-N-acetylglucosamine 2-epimerase (non-hydrolyzing) [Bacteroidales bacterium]
MKKIVTVIGARPQFIKASPVSRAIRDGGNIREVIIHTGQHFDDNMSKVFFEQMQIPRPDYELSIHSLSHGAMTGRMMESIESVLIGEKPDKVMVYGDTNSTLAGALAASKLHIPVAHVEAGLRSFNMRMPEEINRILTDRISSQLFCPTPTAAENLNKEGFGHFESRFMVTGDVMYDAALMFAEKASSPAGFEVPDTYVLTTIHRQENTDDLSRLSAVIEALNSISKSITLVFPVHPRTQKLLKNDSLPALSSNIKLIPPAGYLEMLFLLKNCQMVITDSGGVQKEAYFFEKPCITLRDETEWTELVEAGYNKICGNDKALITQAFDHFRSERLRFAAGLYGDGNASAIIASALNE